MLPTRMALAGAASHRGFDDVGADDLLAVLAEADAALAAADVPYLLIGGQASAVLGRRRASGDIDILVAPHEAHRALEALAAARFDTDQTNPHWIFKATKDGVLLDLLFKVKGDIYLDADMLARAPLHEVAGRLVRIMPAEDLVVAKALAHDEESSRHWFDALALIAQAPLDWEYLLRRAAKGPRRVLSLLVYATSSDLAVPPAVIRRLHALAFGEPESNGAS